MKPVGSVISEQQTISRAHTVRLIECLAGQRILALTGAGISTESGVPDYRGPDSPKRTPMTFQQFVGSSVNRQRYWARNHLGWQYMESRSPNPGHAALAELERSGAVAHLITQNVDLLHTKAGHRTVIDLHGTYRSVVCLNCGSTTDRKALAKRLTELNADFGARAALDGLEIAPDADAIVHAVEHFRVAACVACGGILKPDIVFFGESVPRERVEHAYAAVDDATALLVAGSSLTVMSGLRFVRYAAKQGKPIVIINRGQTRGDDLAALKLNAGCTEVLTTLARLLT
ncbi:NAD-dependent SIR2 family protein deacetylase [Hoyosella altamirensis]|uniref:NAD-dependent protein deacetylase n=1 Tax=Hoyosella altamirensis TaxID=616997 RepID=A0A839RRW8_9ACTN|nr:NAD-dependent SIR2 family protein deacetylase [Hoyosella altamirensis]